MSMFGLLGPPRHPRSRPLLIVAIGLWIPLAALLVHVGTQAHDAARRERDHGLAALARNIRIAVDAILDAHVAGLTTLARSSLLDTPRDLGAFAQQATIASAVLGGSIMLRGPAPEVTVLVNTSPHGPALARLDDTGPFAAAIVPSMTGVYEARRATLSDLFLAPGAAAPVIAVAIPVLREGEPVRRLSQRLDAGMFEALLARTGLPAGIAAAIRDGRFAIVARSDTGAGVEAEGSWSWLRDGMTGVRSAILSGPDASGEEVVVAAERLATDPRWMVTVTAQAAGNSSARLAALAPGGLAAALILLAVGAVLWAARQERLRTTLEKAATLRKARDLVERLHAGLPAILMLRSLTPEGEPGRVLYLAGDVEGVCGWPASTPFDVFQGDLVDDPQALRAYRRRLVREGEAWIELRLRQPGGGWRWLRWKSRLLKGMAGAPIVAVGYILDVTAEREAQARAEAASRLASMAEMAHGLAHELKQPLQVIALKAETGAMLIGQAVQEPGVPEPVREAAARIDAALEEITGQALRTGDLVEHLRRFARGNAEGAPIGPVNLAEALDGALVLAGHGLMKAGVAVEYDLGDPPPSVTGQLIAIEQILINLLNNARDALAERPREAPRRVRIAASRSPDSRRIALSVADTAGGVPAHVIDRVFEPFVTTKRVDKGTGLGLAICHGLARGMGGEITVRNAAEGAVFTLTLPAAEQDHAAAMPAAQEDRAVA